MSNEFEQYAAQADAEWETRLMSLARDLPEETMPSALLEERTIRELRRRGLLRRKRGLPSGWLVGSLAASIALFATGVAVGQWLATRSTADAMVALAQKDPAAQIQRTGSAYVRALEALVTAGRDQSDPQAREVALSALHAAANEIVRIAPNDPVAVKILQGIEQARRESQPRDESAAQRQIVWF